MNRTGCSAAAWAAAAWLSAAAAAGQQFRVETEVFAGGRQEAPVVETLTLFDGDVVYDFLLNDPQEITIFDFKRRRVVLLDPERRVRTTLSMDELNQLTAALKRQPAEGWLAKLLDPQFEEEADPAKGRLTLRSDVLTYEVAAAAPELPEAAEQYRRFADCCARLNATRPGNPPPFGRLALNRSLARRGWMPTEVRRTLRPAGQDEDEPLEARSRHLAIWRLSGRDRDRIELAGRYQAKFAEVPLDAYRQLAAAPAAPRR